MRPRLIAALSSALFKSYLRASRGGRISFFSKPRVMLLVDAASFLIPLAFALWIMGMVPEDYTAALATLVAKAMIGVPILMTSAVIVAGLLFELGQGSAISSSEAVNWLPLTPGEYVVSSALSTSFVYSEVLAIIAGLTLPLALRSGLISLWLPAMLLSALSLMLGALIVEILRSVMNRVSSTVYRRSGRLGMVSRLVALVLLFVVIQLAFQPYLLYYVLGQLTTGVEVFWIIPIVWPAIAMINFTTGDLFRAALFSGLSVVFVLVVYEAASQLRRIYWSPVPISISYDSSAEYIPQASSGLRLGYNPLEAALALKEFRALLRRKELARFIAIPIVIVVSSMLPILLSPGGGDIKEPIFVVSLIIPFLVPLMFSMITIGQEGKSVINLLTLPIKPSELIKGKLAPAWLISGVATLGVVLGLEFITPIGLINVSEILMTAFLVILINSFVGLGVGARWPNYNVGARSRYVSLTGFLIGFLLAGLASLLVFTPVVLGFLGGVESVLGFSTMLLFPLSLIVGCVVLVLSYVFCRRGVENLLTNF